MLAVSIHYDVPTAFFISANLFLLCCFLGVCYIFTLHLIQKNVTLEKEAFIFAVKKLKMFN